MKTLKVILGTISFIENGAPEKQHAYVQSIEEIYDLPENIAEAVADDLTSHYASYLIPELFKGKIEWSCKTKEEAKQVIDILDYLAPKEKRED